MDLCGHVRLSVTQRRFRVETKDNFRNLRQTDMLRYEPSVHKDVNGISFRKQCPEPNTTKHIYTK
jgi:hypothetical protein